MKQTKNQKTSKRYDRCRWFTDDFLSQTESADSAFADADGVSCSWFVNDKKRNYKLSCSWLLVVLAPEWTMVSFFLGLFVPFRWFDVALMTTICAEHIQIKNAPINGRNRQNCTGTKLITKLNQNVQAQKRLHYIVFTIPFDRMYLFTSFFSNSFGHSIIMHLRSITRLRCTAKRQDIKMH